MNRRVLAMRSIKDGVMYIYGEGELMPASIPDIDPYREYMMTNPCIKLDSGQYVWGFQCWWGDKSRIMEEHGKHIKSIVTTPIDIEIFPYVRNNNHEH